MKNRHDRILAIINYLEESWMRDEKEATGLETAPSGYALSETFPSGGKWTPFSHDMLWGGSDEHQLFRCRVAGTEGKPLAVILRTGDTDIWNTDNPQILMYQNGMLRSTMDMNHQIAVLTEKAGKDESFDLGFYAYSNLGSGGSFFRLSTFTPAFNVLSLLFDMKNVFEAASLLSEGDVERIKAYKVLEDAIDALDTRSLEQLDGSTEAARSVIRAYLESQKPSDATVWSVGSTHIDVAWKWPVRQTREKAVRSVLTALNLMKHYPDFRFLLTQPQVYEFVRESTPHLFEEIKKRIKEGRWEAEGAMWLESDEVIAGGEALVRQILYGKRYIRETLGGGESEILWLPDAFGFNGNLPQLMAKSGIRYFMTTKINWSDTHIFPYDTFTWRGIDGSEVLTHFISTRNYGRTDFNTTYNGLQNASQIMGTWERFQDKDVSEDVLTCYGYGDGGGGPTFQMLENTERLKHSPARCPGAKHATAREYFRHLESTLDRKRLPVWTGEMYFEYHRGILTSIAEEKKWNRKTEVAVHDAEFLAAFSPLDWPRKELDSIWKTLLLNDFHDILPGSAIDEVYETAISEYREAMGKCQEISRKALDALLPSDRESTAALSTSSHKRTGIVLTDEECNGSYATYDGRWAYVAKDVPSYGYSCETESYNDAVISGTLPHISTPYFDVSFADDGSFSSLYDRKGNRQILKNGKNGNILVSYEDRPLKFDNWNLEEYYREKGYGWQLEDGGLKVIENTPARGVVEVVRTSDRSRVTQRIIFYNHTPRIDFDTTIEWDNDHLLLKAEFPVDVHAFSADYEMQFGYVSRSTVENTDWDKARFEVPAHRWCDLSEPGYGISLINDSRYGYSIKDSNMTISLLKSGTFPARNADRGIHQTTYSLFPHSGTWREGGTLREAEDINMPLIPIKASGRRSLLSIDADGVVIDTVKRAEDDGKALILRLYEAYGNRTESTLTLPGEYRILETDLMENVMGEAGKGRSVTLLFHPFEIRTLRLEAVNG